MYKPCGKARIVSSQSLSGTATKVGSGASYEDDIVGRVLGRIMGSVKTRGSVAITRIMDHGGVCYTFRRFQGRIWKFQPCAKYFTALYNVYKRRTLLYSDNGGTNCIHEAANRDTICTKG
jgi:hypothetical protein